MAGKKVAAAAKKAAQKQAPPNVAAIRAMARKAPTQAAARKSPGKQVASKQSAVTRSTSSKIAIGKKVPAFSSLITGGTTWKSSAAAGKNLVVYFYPRDNTTGCTLEGQQFRDLAPAFAKANTMILGVSTDSIASHEKFKAKYEFPFELLSDEQRELCELFDVIKEKSMYGRKFLGVERSTFLIDATGVLRQEWRKVKVPGHAAAVLEAAKAL